MFRQFGVGVVEVAVEVVEGELQAIFGGGEMHRGTEDFVPLMDIERFRATQVNGQRRIVAAEAIAAGAHVDRSEGIDGFEGWRGIACGNFQTEQIAVVGAAQVQLQGIADHRVIARDTLEHFAQTATGHQRVSERMERGRADEPRHTQTNRRVAADLHS